MNVVVEDNSESKKKLKILYVSIIAICIISIIGAFIIQIKKDDDSIGTGGNRLPELTDDKISEYKTQFNNIFENKVNYDIESCEYTISKVNEKEEIVYLGYKNNENKINDYELDVNIPYININNKVIDEFNKQIKDTFENKARNVLNSKNKNVIYTVDYSAYVANNILSVIVRSTLKEGTNAQRDIVQTYNYDLTNHKKCTIDDMLKLKNISQKDANQKIEEEIKAVQKRVEEFANLGYKVYTRNYSSDIYDVSKATEYFIGEDNALYIIYAYGNENFTSEMDIVVM